MNRRSNPLEKKQNKKKSISSQQHHFKAKSSTRKARSTHATSVNPNPRTRNTTNAQTNDVVHRDIAKPTNHSPQLEPTAKKTRPPTCSHPVPLPHRGTRMIPPSPHLAVQDVGAVGSPNDDRHALPSGVEGNGEDEAVRQTASSPDVQFHLAGRPIYEIYA